MKEIKWKKHPEEHDYPAAAEYLSLLLDHHEVKRIVHDLKDAPMVERKAKDIIRASGLPVLPVSDEHVAKVLRKVEEGEEVSPILLVRSPGWGTLIIADGYHRACASYHLETDTSVPCKLVSG